MARCLRYTLGVGYLCAYSVCGQRRPESGVSNRSSLRFFMDLSGNNALLDSELVAFFASRTPPEQAWQLARDWAHKIALTDKVVISGFHSPLEREVYRILDSHRRPVVVALGRAIYRKIPPLFHAAYDDRRLLFVSLRNHSRHSLSNSQIRNWAAADLAEEVVFAPFPPSSALSTLHHTLRLGTTKIVVLE